MKQITAKTPEQVKAWVEQHSHHIGYVEGAHPDYTHLTLANREHRLRIPTAVHRQCKLTNVHNDPTRMFVWDEQKGDIA